MAQKAIIFTANRVVRRLTTDASPPLAADESTVDTSGNPIDLNPAGSGTGYWKLDTSTPPNRVAASAGEVTAANVDPAQVAAAIAAVRAAYKSAVSTGGSLTFGISISLGGGGVAIANVGTSYDSTNPSGGLGVCLVDFDQAVAMVLVVKLNKVGTGTQTWQLWNDTDNTEIGHVDDAGASGIKTLTITLNAAAVTALALTGIKTLRVRAKSTVSTDGPIYYGSTLGVRINPFSDFFTKLTAFLN